MLIGRPPTFVSWNKLRIEKIEDDKRQLKKNITKFQPITSSSHCDVNESCRYLSRLPNVCMCVGLKERRGGGCCRGNIFQGKPKLFFFLFLHFKLFHFYLCVGWRVLDSVEVTRLLKNHWTPLFGERDRDGRTVCNYHQTQWLGRN